MKKKTLISISISATILLFVLIGLLLFVTNYKKVYVFDETYELKLTREHIAEKELIKINNKEENFFNKNHNTATFSGKEVNVSITIYDNSDIKNANVINSFECNKMIWNKTKTNIESNLYHKQLTAIYWALYDYKVKVKYEEYPLCKSKNALIVTFYIKK